MKGGAFLAVFIAALTPFAIVVLLVFGSTQGFVAWKPPVLWTSEFGDPNLDSGVAGIASGNDGVYVVGAFNYTTSVNYYATFAPFLRGYRADGSIAWTDAIGNPRRFYPTGVTVGADGVYVVGSGSSNGTLIKYDLAGNRMWSDTVNASVVSAYGDGVYVVGVSSHGVTNQSFTGSVVFVREYGSNGGVVWTNEFSNSSYALGIYAGASGVFVLTSRSIVGYSLTGRELWIHQVGVGLLTVPLSISC